MIGKLCCESFDFRTMLSLFVVHVSRNDDANVGSFSEKNNFFAEKMPKNLLLSIFFYRFLLISSMYPNNSSVPNLLVALVMK